MPDRHSAGLTFGIQCQCTVAHVYTPHRLLGSPTAVIRVGGLVIPANDLLFDMLPLKV